MENLIRTGQQCPTANIDMKSRVVKMAYPGYAKIFTGGVDEEEHTKKPLMEHT